MIDVQRFLELLGLLALLVGAGACFGVVVIQLVPERGKHATGEPHRAAHARRLLRGERR